MLSPGSSRTAYHGKGRHRGASYKYPVDWRLEPGAWSPVSVCIRCIDWEGRRMARTGAITRGAAVINGQTTHAHTLSLSQTAHQLDGPTGRQDSVGSPPCLRRSCSGPAGAGRRSRSKERENNSPYRRCGKTKKTEPADAHSWMLVTRLVSGGREGRVIIVIA